MKQLFLLFLFAFAVDALGAEIAPTEARDRIADLRREISRHDELYHRKAAPEISDAAYDRLKQELAVLERAHPEAALAAPPLAALGDDRSGLFQTVRHRAPMLSLDKAYTPAEVRAFHDRLVRTLGNDDLDFVVEPKVDGLAVSVTYEKGRLRRAVTRGNGIEGDDITANIVRIAGLPENLLSDPKVPVPALIEVRGEVFVQFAEFERLNATREAAGEPPFASPRNLAAGTVRQTNPADIAARGLRLAFFGVGKCEPATALPATQHELYAAFERWGLPVVRETRNVRGVEAIVVALEALGRARPTLTFPADGAVVKLDELSQQRAVGISEVAPRWALAYKFAAERAETRLRAITLQVGRTGVLTPVAELEPVQLAGSKIARATLHNREEIARKDIRVGDFVFVEKAGDVIPAIVGVNLERRPADAAPYRFPVGCPECYAPLEQSEAEAAVRCSSRSCPAQVQRRVDHFASKGCLDIEGLGPAMVAALVGNGWVKDLPDLYRLRREDLLTLGKNNEKSIDRLLAALEKSKRADLWRVIHGLGLPQVGAATAKNLARQCGSLAALAENGPKAAVVLGDPRYQVLIADLIAVGFSSDATEGARGGKSLAAGKVFALTGTLPHLTRAEATIRIEAAGGKIAGSVTRSTDYIVVGHEPGAKLEQARTWGIAMLDEAALLLLLASQ